MAKRIQRKKRTDTKPDPLKAVQAYFESEAFRVWMARCDEMRAAILFDCAMYGHDVRTIPGVEGPICVRCGWQEDTSAQEGTQP